MSSVTHIGFVNDKRNRTCCIFCSGGKQTTPPPKNSSIKLNSFQEFIHVHAVIILIYIC